MTRTSGSGALGGTWVFVCGPSGAGKDSVIGWARAQLADRPGIVFAQRLETRPAPPGADHLALDEARFAQLLRRGGLAWHWEAHGLHYGIESRYACQVAWGRVVVVNGSREHVAGLAVRDNVRVVQIAAGGDRLAVRLAGRGREGAEAIAARLARNARLGGVTADCEILNEGPLAEAGQQLAGYLLAWLGRAEPACA